MPVTNSTALMNSYDRSTQTQVPNQPSESGTPQGHHAMHCLAFEVLRGWMGTGLTVDQYNAMDEAAWQTLRTSVCNTAVTRARLNPASARESALLTINDRAAACNLGDNYFEHGYDFVISGTTPSDRRNFTRDDGIS